MLYLLRQMTPGVYSWEFTKQIPFASLSIQKDNNTFIRIAKSRNGGGDMESILMLGRLLSFISLLVFPQLLGVLVYFRLTRLPNWIAVTLAALTPPLVFFFLSPVFSSLG
jgi:hypothetical protein